MGKDRGCRDLAPGTRGARADWTRVEGCRSPGEEPTEEPKTRRLCGRLHCLCHQAVRTRRWGAATWTGARQREPARGTGCLPNGGSLRHGLRSRDVSVEARPGSGFPAAILQDLAFTIGDRGSSCRPRPKVTRSKAAALYSLRPSTASHRLPRLLWLDRDVRPFAILACDATAQARDKAATSRRAHRPPPARGA